MIANIYNQPALLDYIRIYGDIRILGVPVWLIAAIIVFSVSAIIFRANS